MSSDNAMVFRPGQKVFLNPSTIPQIEKEFTLGSIDADSCEVQRITTIAEECTCGCDVGDFKMHLPLCNLLRIKEFGDNRLLSVITSKKLLRTHPANWFTDKQPVVTPNLTPG